MTEAKLAPNLPDRMAEHAKRYPRRSGLCHAAGRARPLGLHRGKAAPVTHLPEIDWPERRDVSQMTPEERREYAQELAGAPEDAGRTEPACAGAPRQAGCTSQPTGDGDLPRRSQAGSERRAAQRCREVSGRSDIAAPQPCNLRRSRFGSATLI